MRNLDPRLYAFIYGAGSALATFIVTFGTARLANTALEPAFWIAATAALAPFAIRQTEGVRDYAANKRADARAAEPPATARGGPGHGPVGEIFDIEISPPTGHLREGYVDRPTFPPLEKPVRLERSAAIPPPPLAIDFDQPYHRSPAGIAHPGDHAEGCGWCATEVR